MRASILRLFILKMDGLFFVMSGRMAGVQATLASIIIFPLFTRLLSLSSETIISVITDDTQSCCLGNAPLPYHALFGQLSLHPHLLRQGSLFRHTENTREYSWARGDPRPPLGKGDTIIFSGEGAEWLCMGILPEKKQGGRQAMTEDYSTPPHLVLFCIGLFAKNAHILTEKELKYL